MPLSHVTIHTYQLHPQCPCHRKWHPYTNLTGQRWIIEDDPSSSASFPNLVIRIINCTNLSEHAAWKHVMSEQWHWQSESSTMVQCNSKLPLIKTPAPVCQQLNLPSPKSSVETCVWQMAKGLEVGRVERVVERSRGDRCDFVRESFKFQEK